MSTSSSHFVDINDAIAAAEARYARANPQSLAQHQRAARVLPAGHSRQVLFYPPYPLTIARASGAHVSDIDGHTYLNLIGDFAAGVYGASCAPIHAAVRETLDGGLSLSGVNRKEVELAELISQRIPSIEQLRFCNSGSEACLYSAMLARHATQRTKLLVFNGCYHGGFMIYGANDPPLSIPFDLVKADFNDVAGSRTLLREHAKSLAAVFVEPMMGSAGCIPSTPEFLSMLREETRAIGAVLVMDEVMTSRLAPGGLQGEYGIVPDLTTLGKFWGGGLAFGAFGGSRDLMKHFDMPGGGTLSQSGTFNNNIMAMSAGLVGARDVYTPDVCRTFNALGDHLRKEINTLGASAGVPLQATGRGAVMNIHWHTRPVLNAGDVGPASAPVRRLFQLEMLNKGYYVAQRGIINLSLPFTKSDLAGFLAALNGFICDYGHLLRSARR